MTESSRHFVAYTLSMTVQLLSGVHWLKESVLIWGP